MNQLRKYVVSLDEVSEDLVVEYLCTHPEFFQKHEDLLQKLDLSHDCGPASSLIERQVGQLRDYNSFLEVEKLSALKKAAVSSHKLMNTKELTLELLKAKSIKQLFFITQLYLKKNLRINHLRLGLIKELMFKRNTDNIFLLSDLQFKYLTDGVKEKVEVFGLLMKPLKSSLLLSLGSTNQRLGVLCVGGEHPRQFELGGDKQTLQYIADVFTYCLQKFKGS